MRFHETAELLLRLDKCARVAYRASIFLRLRKTRASEARLWIRLSTCHGSICRKRGDNGDIGAAADDAGAPSVDMVCAWAQRRLSSPSSAPSFCCAPANTCASLCRQLHALQSLAMSFMATGARIQQAQRNRWGQLFIDVRSMHFWARERSGNFVEHRTREAFLRYGRRDGRYVEANHWRTALEIIQALKSAAQRGATMGQSGSVLNAFHSRVRFPPPLP